MSSEKNQKAIKPGAYLSFTLWFFKCDVILLPKAGCGMWIGLLIHPDVPEHLFSRWYRLFFGILEAPAVHSVSLLIAIIFTKMSKQFFL